MRTPRSFAAEDDRGMAAVTVLILGLSLVLLASVVAFRSMVQSRSIYMDAAWEESLAVAEAGLDDGLDKVRADENYTTGESITGFADTAAEREWVIAAADLRSEADVEAVPGGEYVVIRPANSEVVYSVGYVPSRDSDERRVRVVSGEIGLASQVASWQARYAVLSGGDLSFGGNPTVLSGSTVGVHANGHLYIGGSSFIEGCVGASGGATINGSYSQAPGCAPPGSQAPVSVPIIDVLALWPFSQYDMCPDGRVRAGPAHPTMGNTVVSSPCSGATLQTDAGTTPYRSWKWVGCCDPKLGARWTYENDLPYDGVYYFHQASVDIASNPGAAGAPWQVTILVAGQGACPNTIGGDLSISGDPTMVPYPETSNLLLAVGRDLEISGNPDISGLIGVHEQLKVNGNATAVEAAFVTESICDSTEDNIHQSEWSGNPSVQNSGPVASPFRGNDDVPIVVGWREL
jgi:hypothetical protein